MIRSFGPFTESGINSRMTLLGRPTPPEIVEELRKEDEDRAKALMLVMDAALGAYTNGESTLETVISFSSGVLKRFPESFQDALMGRLVNQAIKSTPKQSKSKKGQVERSEFFRDTIRKLVDTVKEKEGLKIVDPNYYSDTALDRAAEIVSDLGVPFSGAKVKEVLYRKKP